MAFSDSITSRLLQNPLCKPLYQRATQAHFLRAAGQGRLSKALLSQWLSQDRLYAQAYVRFIGGLLSRIRLPVSGAGNSLEWRILRMLNGALEGIMKELLFFEKAAKDYGLNLTQAAGSGEFGPNKAAMGYIELFDSFAAGSKYLKERTLLEGLVLLWATENVYLDSWTYAKEQGKESETTDLDGGALRKAFISNWTSEVFRGFVEEIRECVDAFAVAALGMDGGGVEKIAMEIWEVVLVLEEGFWPYVE
jgi:thiaminase